ncbi:putative sugar kinase [Nannochloris sp. 'desiccata']|nr:putative sugar kinase [Chlorella desiccata (nom. nud.)]
MSVQPLMASRTSSGRIIGFGDPVLDLVSSVSFEALDSLDMQAGGCTAIPRSELERLLSLPEINNGDLLTVPGGSACNVCKCLAGLRANRPKGLDDEILFIGMIGMDSAGADFHSMLEASGVKPLLPQCDTEDTSTASCLCLVSPDGQRTMRTYLGAAQKLTSAEQLPIGTSDLENVGLVHFEGYSLYKIDVAEATMRSAREAGSKISLDLASFEIVNNCWEALTEKILKEKLVDILFCNEDEARAACEAGKLLEDVANSSADDVVESALRYLLQSVEVVVISRGADGCLVGTADGQRATAAAENVTVIDTIGAGDYFSAGFLHAWVSGAPLVACAACGCAAGGAAVQAAGAELGAVEMKALRNKIQSILDSSSSVDERNQSYMQLK